MRKKRLIEAVVRIEREAQELSRLCAQLIAPTEEIRYLLVRRGRTLADAPAHERVTYPSQEIACRWASRGERVVAVRVSRSGPFADRVQALDEQGAAALEGVFLHGEVAQSCASL